MFHLIHHSPKVWQWKFHIFVFNLYIYFFYCRYIFITCVHFSGVLGNNTYSSWWVHIFIYLLKYHCILFLNISLVSLRTNGVKLVHADPGILFPKPININYLVTIKQCHSSFKLGLSFIDYFLTTTGSTLCKKASFSSPLLLSLSHLFLPLSPTPHTHTHDTHMNACMHTHTCTCTYTCLVWLGGLSFVQCLAP